jgi:hypothetical protein
MYKTGDGGTPSAETGVLHAQAIKAHILTEVTPTANSWTDFTGFTFVPDESNGDSLSLNADTKTFEINREGLYQFGGCIHYIDGGGFGFNDLIVLSRIYINGSDEVRCSQRGKDQILRVTGEEVLSYNGTAYLKSGDTLTLQYYTNKTAVRFFSNALFDSPVAATLWMIYVGTY